MTAIEIPAAPPQWLALHNQAVKFVPSGRFNCADLENWISAPVG